MSPVDSLLALAHREGATELRLGTDRAPAMFGTPKRLSVPKTPPDMLRHLLGELLSPEAEAAVRARGRVETTYPVAGVGTFRVTLSRRDADDGLDVTFVLSGADAPPAVPARPVTSVRPRRESGPVERTETNETAPSPPPSALPTELVELLYSAVRKGASDVHVATGELPTFRIHGALSAHAEVGPIDVEGLLGGLLGPLRPRLTAGASADFVFPLPSTAHRAPRVRGNVYRAGGGLAVAFRILPALAPSLDGTTSVLADLALLPNGLVIVAGPAGSGKTTTLAALAREILEKRSVLLVSLEDPIEYALEGVRGRSLVRQRQIGRDVRDFATGLRDALREDPDVILVGEMRDADSVALALTAAETGHLVLATLHSRSSASTVERIVDTYPEGRQTQVRGQLADALRAVVTQRLVPRARGGGRAVALEVLRVNASVASGLREGKLGVITSTMQSGKRDGMFTLERSLAELVRRGEVRLEDASAVANDRESLANYLK